MSYLGIDGCKAGWFVVAVEKSTLSAAVFPNLSEAKHLLSDCRLALIDIPIGLKGTDSTERGCDTTARRLLGKPRSSSVFPAPSRAALEATDYEHASRLNRTATGRGLSKQSFAIIPKICEVDRFKQDHPMIRIREMHPEIIFWALNGRHAMPHKKSTAIGFDERLELLCRKNPGVTAFVTDCLTRFRRSDVAKDDILDAVAGALVAADRIETIPIEPEVDDLGMTMEMVYPAER